MACGCHGGELEGRRLPGKAEEIRRADRASERHDITWHRPHDRVRKAFVEPAKNMSEIVLPPPSLASFQPTVRSATAMKFLETRATIARTIFLGDVQLPGLGLLSNRSIVGPTTGLVREKLASAMNPAEYFRWAGKSLPPPSPIEVRRRTPTSICPSFQTGFRPPLESLGERCSCCVTDLEIVLSGKLKGDFTFEDYWRGIGMPKRGMFGDDPSEAGPVDEAFGDLGYKVQFVGTAPFLHDVCRFTQQVKVLRSRVNGEAQPDEGSEFNDFEQGGGEDLFQQEPRRRRINPDQSAFADPTSTRILGDPALFEDEREFTTCFHSFPNDPGFCEFSKCCIVWNWKYVPPPGFGPIVKPRIEINVVRKWCEPNVV